jgi:hypothetical protein
METAFYEKGRNGVMQTVTSSIFARSVLYLHYFRYSGNLEREASDLQEFQSIASSAFELLLYLVRFQHLRPPMAPRDAGDLGDISQIARAEALQVILHVRPVSSGLTLLAAAMEAFRADASAHREEMGGPRNDVVDPLREWVGDGPSSGFKLSMSFFSTPARQATRQGRHELLLQRELRT